MNSKYMMCQGLELDVIIRHESMFYGECAIIDKLRCNYIIKYCLRRVPSIERSYWCTLFSLVS